MKTKNAAWFVSNCNRPESKRKEYAEELSKFIDVDIYGRCGPLDCPKENQSQCINLLNSTYRYYLAFENSFCKDYVTEKIFDQFKGVHVIPVVRGGADYKKIFPDGTYINAADFKRPADLADHLKRLGSDLDAYSAMLRRKSRYRYKDMHPQAYCKLCELLHSPKEKTYSNFPKWLWDGMCWEPNDV
nr:hypothetical protein BaRGS_032422 [Batillaria attramentaria]